jgi:2-polyprenyl-6-methoxyphenol hydroxylase-like FAD-dependent oxidoreductase
MPDIVVVGAGPVGTLLAGELARQGVEALMLERRISTGDGTRAIGVHAPVLAALEGSGITEILLASAVRVRAGEARAERRRLGTVRFDRLDRRFPFVATLPQSATEAALAAGAPVPQRGVTVTALTVHGSGIRVTLDTDGHVDAPIVVVAGGRRARDLVYRRGGVRVRDYPDRYLMADVEADVDGDIAVVNIDRTGVLESCPLPAGRRRFVAWDPPDSEATDAARLARLRGAVRRGGDHDAAARIEGAWPFEVRRAVAPALRRGGLFVIGDAAHEVSPIGGQGMNLGLLDAATLAPLLARWVHSGSAPDAELDRWERRRVASARTAARLAAVNTSLGRPLGAVGHAVRRAAIRAALMPPGARLLAHAYSMGFDRDAEVRAAITL